MKAQIAYSNGKWAIPVLVADDGMVFYTLAGTDIRLPFVTTEKYQLVDANDLKSITTKYILAEMKIKALKKKVDENYSSQYLQKYFEEKFVNLPEIEAVQKIVVKYSKFLNEIVLYETNSDYGQRWSVIKQKDITQLEKDAACIELFMEYLKEDESLVISK